VAAVLRESLIVPADMFDQVVHLLHDYRAVPAESGKGASEK